MRRPRFAYPEPYPSAAAYPHPMALPPGPLAMPAPPMPDSVRAAIAAKRVDEAHGDSRPVDMSSFSAFGAVPPPAQLPSVRQAVADAHNAVRTAAHQLTSWEHEAALLRGLSPAYGGRHAPRPYGQPLDAALPGQYGAGLAPLHAPDFAAEYAAAHLPRGERHAWRSHAHAHHPPPPPPPPLGAGYPPVEQHAIPGYPPLGAYELPPHAAFAPPPPFPPAYYDDLRSLAPPLPFGDDGYEAMHYLPTAPPLGGYERMAPYPPPPTALGGGNRAVGLQFATDLILDEHRQLEARLAEAQHELQRERERHRALEARLRAEGEPAAPTAADAADAAAAADDADAAASMARGPAVAPAAAPAAAAAGYEGQRARSPNHRLIVSLARAPACPTVPRG